MDYCTYLDDYYINNKIDFSTILEINVSKFATFIHVINHWSQVLGLTLFKCSDYKKRKNIVKNLYDENNHEYTHVETFYHFLLELNYSNTIENIPLDTDATFAIKEISDLIINYNFNDSCQILGAIEYTYQKICIDFIKWFQSKYGHSPKNHFTLHEALDIEHAKELFDLIDNDINEKKLKKGADWIINTIKKLIILP